MVLARYVLKEHVAPFLFSFCVIMFLLVVDLILQKMDLILGKGISPLIVAELFFLNTAWMVALAIPMAVLVGGMAGPGHRCGGRRGPGNVQRSGPAGIQLSGPYADG